MRGTKALNTTVEILICIACIAGCMAVVPAHVQASADGEVQSNP